MMIGELQQVSSDHRIQVPAARMPEVSFRFYARLNDFLPPNRRGRRFTHVMGAVASVKDTIEALGVPHPEVDLVLVNGSAEDFTYRLRGGDEVAVYPLFRSIDLADLRRAGADVPRPVRFALDVHLGRLAALLRFAGFDAVLVAEDPDLARTGAREERAILTRDVQLLKRSAVRHGYWVRHTNPESQLVEVLERFDLVDCVDAFARCVRCNVLLVPASAESIADRLLPRTRACFREFHTCPACGRIYWRGSHYERMSRLLQRVRERASGRSAASGSQEPAIEHDMPGERR
jgi:uncharacterized protein with PIN domain